QRMIGNSGAIPEVYLPPEELKTLDRLHPLKLEVVQESERNRSSGGLSTTPVTAHMGSESERGCGADDASPTRETLAKSDPESQEDAADSVPSNPIRPRSEVPAEPALSAEDRARNELMQELAIRSHYVDPVGENYQGRWLAAVEPVIVEDRPPAIADT